MSKKVNYHISILFLFFSFSYNKLDRSTFQAKYFSYLIFKIALIAIMKEIFSVYKANKCWRSCRCLSHIIYLQSSAFIRRRLYSGSCVCKNVIEFTCWYSHCVLRINKFNQFKKSVNSLACFCRNKYNRCIRHKRKIIHQFLSVFHHCSTVLFNSVPFINYNYTSLTHFMSNTCNFWVLFGKSLSCINHYYAHLSTFNCHFST